MFYAGPREAIHHSNIRQAIGFKNFIIGLPKKRQKTKAVRVESIALKVK